MDNDEVVSLAKEIAKGAVKELITEQKDKRLHNTRLLVKNYLTLKKHIEDVKEDITIELDLLDDEGCSVNDIWIISIARSKTRTAKMLGYLENAMEIAKKEFEEKGESYKYKAFELYYIEKKSKEEIMKELQCSVNIPRKWSNLVIDKLNILLWGIDALGI